MSSAQLVRTIDPGGGECVLYGPPPTQPLVDAECGNSKVLSPLGNTQCFAIKGDEFVGSTIPSLLGPCCPAAVRRLVVAIIVNTLDSVLRARWLAHVGVKILKLVPTLTHRNSSDVSAKIWMWISAPRAKSNPDFVDASVCLSVC